MNDIYLLGKKIIAEKSPVLFQYKNPMQIGGNIGNPKQEHGAKKTVGFWGKNAAISAVSYFPKPLMIKM